MLSNRFQIHEAKAHRCKEDIDKFTCKLLNTSREISKDRDWLPTTNLTGPALAGHAPDSRQMFSLSAHGTLTKADIKQTSINLKGLKPYGLDFLTNESLITKNIWKVCKYLKII